MHFLEIIKNEICAGGLDGVPVSHLWHILQEPLVNFPISIDDNTKEFLWDKIRAFRIFDFYVRPEEPPPYEYIDRFASLEDENNQQERSALVLKLSPVDEQGVYGSCPDFKTRICVNSEISVEELPYSEAYRRWGDRLVVVAPQMLRIKFLTGLERLPNSINPKLYRILELIAKSRYNGIPISGQNSILSYGETSSALFYIRKLFTACGYIKSQPFITHDAVKRNMRRTSLLHSFRFFRPLTYPLALYLEKFSNLLLECKAKMMLPCIIQQKFGMGRRSFARIVKFGIQQGCLKLIRVSFGTACALISNTDGDCGEICAELLRKESIDLSNLDDSPMPLSETSGRHFVRDTSVLYLQHPFDIEKYMINAHIDRGSRPDSILQHQEGAQGDSSFTLDESVLPDGDVDEKEEFTGGPFYAPRVNGEEPFCVQVCRFLCGFEAKSNSLMAAHFNTSHRDFSKFADGLAGIGKLITSKVSVGTTFSLVRRYVTEKESLDIRRSITNSLHSDNQREQRRAFILESLEEFRVFPSLLDLRARIWAHEASRGLRGRMDRKSLFRIINDLVREARLKFIDMQVVGRRQDGTPRPVDLQLVCHPSIETDSPELIDCVLAEKKRYMMTPRCYGALKPEEALAATVDDADDADKGNVSSTFPKATCLDEMELIRLPDKNISKLRRRCLLHKFLFYLLYELQADSAAVPNTPKSWAPVYNTDSVVFRYVPPVPRSTGKYFSQFPYLFVSIGSIHVPGWLTLHDVLQSLPMGLFLYLSAPNSAPRLLLQWLAILKGGETSLRPVIRSIISCQIDEANSFSPYRERATLAPDALRRFELLRTPIINCPIPGGHAGGLYAWLMSRYNVNRIYKLIRELSGHGLVTLCGQTSQRHLPMANIYLHRKAVLLDTRFAAPAHHIITDVSNCPLLTYSLSTSADVDTYWLHLRAILMYTPFGFARFNDPALTNFVDLEPPVLSVNSLHDLIDDEETSTPSLPEIRPTTLKRPFSASNTALQAIVDIYETKVQTFVLRGVGGLHAALYKVKAPFEEMGYGVMEQGRCTRYTPQYPSPSLQMQPAVKEVEMRMILGEFEPGLKTVGDGAFWPWAVQLFFDTQPVKELQLPPEYPESLFVYRSRRYPFRISTINEDANASPSEDRSGRFRNRRARSFRGGPSRRRRKRRRLNSDEEASDGSESASSRRSVNSKDDDDGPHSSPFEDLQPIIQSRKRRLHKKSCTSPHIHRRALDERDLEIRNSLHSKRACWNKSEDQLLLTCRVASLFLVGHTREYVCVPSNIVRNILHEYFPIESRDKTSYACSRRLKFLLMLRDEERTQTDILLTKVSSDTELMAKYHIGKTAWVHLYNRDVEQAHHLFKDLVLLIVKNFLPTISQRCPHMLNRSLLIPNVVELFSSEAEPSIPTGSQEISVEDQCSSTRIREMLLKSRETLRSHYDFILLASVHSDQWLPDIGQSRSAIVVETLRNFFLGAIRFRKEVNLSHDSMLFNRILKQYPFEEMASAVKCLATTDSLRKQKSFEDFDLNIVGNFRLKTTLRLTSWCNLQLFINIRFFMEAWNLYKQYSEETRRLRGRQRRQKSKSIASTPTASQTSSSSFPDPLPQPPPNERILIRHDFADPTSGGLVATFAELLHCKSQVKLRVHFDMSCISILRKPCMSLEDRKRCLMSGSDEESRPTSPKRPHLAPNVTDDEDNSQEGSSTQFPYGPSTHIGMTVKLLRAEGKKHNSNSNSVINESLLNMFLDVGSGDETTGPKSGMAVKGKTPRIDIRLSLNGGSVEAVAPSTSAHVIAVDGEPEHKKLCRRALLRFLAPLDWDAAKAKELTKESNSRYSATPNASAADDKMARMLDFIFCAAELGRTLDQMRDRFSDSKLTTHTLRRLMDDQKVFMVGLNEPRFVHWAHLRLWLVHVRDPKQSRGGSGEKTSVEVFGEEAINGTPLPRKIALAVNVPHLEALERGSSERSVSLADSTTKRSPEQQKTSLPAKRADYYFLPQPWISESGAIKSCFFTHLLCSICSFVSRLSGAPMDVLAEQYRHILSPVSFRILCMLLHEVKVVRITRVVGSRKCSLFSTPEPMIYLGDQVYLAPAAELSVTLEPNFLSRMNALIACASELLNMPTPDSPETVATTYDRFARCRAPRTSSILVPQQTAAERTD
ncbi:hypothetical protein Aperf_G00000092131 [Anoplocephala perfoliata]